MRLPQVLSYIYLAVGGCFGQAALGGCQVDGTRLTNSPGAFGSGWWEYHGEWNHVFSGTPIAPRFFITATHVGGKVGEAFNFRNAPYTTVARWTQNDVALFEIDREFPAFAPIYEGNGEVGQVVVGYGRGMGVKTPVVVNGRTRGWYLDGPTDAAWSWGCGVVTRTALEDKTGGFGPMLYVSYDERTPQAQGMTLGDSGGAVFVREGGIWKVGGIVWSIDSPYSFDGRKGFNAIIYDKRGLYESDYAGNDAHGFVNSVTGYKLVNPDAPEAIPGETWCSRVSAHRDWIKSVMAHKIPPVESRHESPPKQ